MNKKELFPIGTVVMIKGGTKRVMITGYFPIMDKDNKMYDYCGCLFPEGYISSELNILFDHANIEKVFYEGVKTDQESIEFLGKLDEYYKEIVDKLKTESKE